MSEEQVAATEETPELVEETPEATAEEVETPTEEQEQEEQPKKRDRSAEGRINELTAKTYALQEQADYWRQQFEERYRQAQPQEQAPQEPQIDLPPAPVPPNSLDFDSDEEYKQALASYQQDNAKYIQTVIDKREEANAKKAQQTQRQQVMNERQLTLTQKLEKGREKYPDFDAVVYDRVGYIDETMMEALTDAENAADIAYYLQTNKEEALKYQGMQPIQKIIAIGKLDAQMALKKPKPTKAPPPGEPVQAGTSSAGIDPVLGPKDPLEWRRWREEQIKQKSGR